MSDDSDFGVPCLVDPGCAADPQGAISDGFFLFDAIHPTTAMHGVIADRAAVLVPEPHPVGGMAASVLALGALSKLGSRRQRRQGSGSPAIAGGGNRSGVSQPG